MGFLLRLHVRIKWVHALVMLELFGLIGAYAAGACRDAGTSNAVLALGGAVLSYVVIHVIFFTMENKDSIHYYVEEKNYAAIVEQVEAERKLEKKLEKKRKLLYLLATLSTAMIYQAGLNPPGGVWLQDGNESGHQAGDPVLLYNHPRRYRAFFYCNSVSFMLSVTTMILLVSPALYRPAIQSNALTLCTVAGLSCLLGAYGAGSTQHLTTSIAIVVLVAVAFLILLVVLLIFLVRSDRTTVGEDLILKDRERAEGKGERARLKHLMLLGILVAGVTFQAGLDPPGGVWQQSNEAGSPVMLSTRRRQYLTFLYSNSTSFAASIVVIMLLVLQSLTKEGLPIQVMRLVVLLDFLGLLVAYAAGSIRGGNSSMIIASLAIPILTYCALMVLARFVLPFFLEERFVLPCTRQRQEAREESRSVRVN
uniref:PGG domain-containing protein n=1 Tax=Aegilops tauschii TaxID=37682 RepID=N1QPJ6_AEGTA